MNQVVPWKAFMNKISQYFSTFVLTRGLIIALLDSAFIYLNHWGFSHPLINTILGLSATYLLLQEGKKVWLVCGAFIALFWFWWIALSLQHYGMTWAVPIEILIIMLSYGALFWLAAWISEKVSSKFSIPAVFIKALFLLTFSYMHPFSFDWFKPELMFMESYLGIEKWQFAFILLGISLSIWKQQFFYLLLVLLCLRTNVRRTMKKSRKILYSSQHTPQYRTNGMKHCIVAV